MQPKAVIILGSDGTGSLVLLTDAQGILQVGPPTSGFNQSSFIFANSDGESTLQDGLVSIGYNYVFNGTTWDRVRSAPGNADALAPSAVGNQAVIAQLFGYDGTNYDRVRLATVFKSVAATAAGLTAVWTPAAGKKFRLMGYTISVAGTLIATGVEAIKLCDNVVGNVISQHNATVAITTPTGDTQIGADLGQGFLSAAANNVLQVNLGTAMSTGSVCVNAWGTEE